MSVKGTVQAEKDIQSIIADILGSRPANSSGSGSVKYVYNKILVVSSEYDYFTLDEEGRFGDLLSLKSRTEERATPPVFQHATEDRAREVLSVSKFDLVFLFNLPDPEKRTELIRHIRKEHGIPVIMVGKSASDMARLHFSPDEGAPHGIFSWSGDGKVFIDIIQLFEDAVNDLEMAGPVVIIAESNPQYYSRFVYEAYGAISKHMNALLFGDLTHSQRVHRLMRRPRVVLTRDAQSLRNAIEQNRQFLACFIMDIGLDPGNGAWDAMQFLEGVKKEMPDARTMLLSCPGGTGDLCMDKGDPALLSALRDFVSTSIGPIELVIEGGSNGEKQVVHDIQELERIIWNVPVENIKDLLVSGSLERWLGVLGEESLAAIVREMSLSLADMDMVRKMLTSAIAEHRRAMRNGIIMTYSRSTDSRARFSRIGRGAMGGKARGLAFVDKLITTYLGREVVNDISVEIPRTVVLCSDVFDDFIEENAIDMAELVNMTDERIAQKFMSGDLPAPVLGDIRAFIRGTKAPLMVRSSSLLEDALHHPFAGVYASLLLPNESWEADIRFQELCTSIKYVFASVYFRKARDYMASLQDVVDEEKMAVIIQETVGSKHGHVFYPTISGVAKSYDYYPSGKCTSDDGVVNLALGLGKEVVDGGTAFRFCPVHPRRPKYGTLENLLDGSQKEFYAVDLDSYVNIVQRNEDSTIKRHPISAAEAHGSLEHAASTYVPEENRLYPGIGRNGIRVLDFAPMLQLDTIPLAKLTHALLRMSEVAIGSPVEMEFAMDIPAQHDAKPRFYVLQVRSMRLTGQDENVEIGEHSPSDLLCNAMHAMGNGVISGIRDIVYVKPDGYDTSQNNGIVAQIRSINERLLKERVPYILIGPGRWGSTDHWLGIPVTWSDIAGARLIVETPIQDRPVDPSQGSHFFHNMVAARTGYLTVVPGAGGTMDWGWLAGFDALEETDNLRHVRLDEPLEARIDGSRSHGVILKKPSGRVD